MKITLDLVKNTTQNENREIKAAKKNLSFNKNFTTPNFAKYSTNNLQANFMPVSKNVIAFKGSTDDATPPRMLPIGNKLPEALNYPATLVNMNRSIKYLNKLKPEEKIKGDFYNKPTEDLAIVLGSNKTTILVQDKDVEAEIFAQSFTKKAKNGNFKGLGIKENTDIIYMKNFRNSVVDTLLDINASPSTQHFAKGINPAIIDDASMKTLSQLSDKNNGSKKIVFIEDFDILGELATMKRRDDVKEFLNDIAPNLMIVGFVDKKNEEARKIQKEMAFKFQGKILKDSMEDTRRMELLGLSSSETKDYLKKNPRTIKNVLSKHSEANLKISTNAIETVVDKTIQNIDGALPKAALNILDMVAVTKLNETKTIAKNKDLMIKTTDVEKFFGKHSGAIAGMKPPEGRFTLAENITTKLDDVGGISSIKQDIKDDLIAYLKAPNKFIKERGVAPKGVLLEGPPGTGKTLLARAIAGETNTPFISTAGSEFVEKYVGVGAQRVRELFSTARQAAETAPNKTAIIFIDEFDAIAKARNGESNGESEQTINQLLTEMDGFNNKESETKIVVIAATNRKDILDPAAIRAGRFDDTFKIDNPRTNDDRLEILQIHAKKLKFKNEEDKKTILKAASKITDGLSGAELAGVMQKTQKIISKRPDNKFVTYNDVVEGYLQTLAGPVKKNGEERPTTDIVKTVRHEGGHATLIDFLKPINDGKISFITLDNRGDFLGAVFREQPKTNPTFKSVVLSAAVSYAGGLAEPNFAENGRAAGVSQDLSQATNLFKKAILEWGQGVFTPPIKMNSDSQHDPSNGFYSSMRDIHKDNISKDITLFSKTAETIAVKVNDFHKGFLDEYVDRFKANAGKGGNNLSGEEFTKLRKDWIKRNGKEDEEKALLKEVNTILSDAMNANKGEKQKKTFFQKIFG